MRQKCQLALRFESAFRQSFPVRCPRICSTFHYTSPIPPTQRRSARLRFLFFNFGFCCCAVTLWLVRPLQCSPSQRLQVASDSALGTPIARRGQLRAHPTGPPTKPNWPTREKL